MTQSPFLPPTPTSTGGAFGGSRIGQQQGLGLVSVVAPPRPRPFPWPLPFSATQGAVGGTGGAGRVSVELPPNFTQKNYGYFPWQVLPYGWLPSYPVKA